MNIVLSGAFNPAFEALPEYLAAALTSLGHRVTLFDHRAYLLPGRLRRRLPGVQALEEARLNRAFLAALRRAEAEVAVVNQGTVLAPATIRVARARGVRCVNWFSDYPAEFERGLLAAPAYDAFHLGSSFAVERHHAAGHGAARWLPFGCDPAVHRPPRPGEAAPPSRAEGRVVLVGSHYPERQVLLRHLTGLPVDVWGPGWDRARDDPHVAPMIRGGALRPAAWRGLFASAAAVLNIHYGAGGPPIASGEMANTRVFEVLACGGTQVVDRRGDVTALFRDGVHLLMFDSGPELRSIIEDLLRDPARGRRIADAGRAEALAAHTYVDRAGVLLGEAAAPERRASPIAARLASGGR